MFGVQCSPTYVLNIGDQTSTKRDIVGSAVIEFVCTVSGISQTYMSLILVVTLTSDDVGRLICTFAGKYLKKTVV